ncbi:DUF6688 family protein [Sporosarcina sp. FSL K6-1522]|uniref:DUF6688 domain-containing protein n=1 Tax=Sporosarcina sp. FSL K6-1522 TaxID=2921554 RepID=UPI003159E22A
MSYLVIVFLCWIPIYSFIRMIRSFFGEHETVHEDRLSKVSVFDAFIMTAILCVMMVGTYLNELSVVAGEPLRVFEMTGQVASNYASLSAIHVSTLFVFFILSYIAYWLLPAEGGKLSPVVYVVCSSLLVVNVVVAFVYITHTGFGNYGVDVAFLQIGYGSIIFLYIAKLNDSLKQFLAIQQERNIQYTNKFLKFLMQMSLKYQRIPMLVVFFVFPVMIVVQFILVLWGQRPDSLIQVFLDTSSYNYSKIPAPLPEMIEGDGHYLCTVSAMGHKRLVKPVRSGIRHGERIVVNRQLLIANAFENILEEHTPNLHKKIRRFYDTYGYPISKHIQTKVAADIVYLLMKPLEWLFLLVLYTVDTHPENRIHVQYSELRNAKKSCVSL